MKRIITIILLVLAGVLSAYIATSFAAVTIPGTDPIINNSIEVNIEPNQSIEGAKNLGFRILGVGRVLISGLALIYLVLIGVYMILGSDSEENIKKQRKQIMYTIIGFLFLNIPSIVYSVFTPDTSSSIVSSPNFSATYGGSLFWNTAGFEGIMGNMIAFLRVFVFGAAVTMFTWGLFNLIVSGGDDEKKKMAKNRIVYGLLGLIFMGFVGIWGELIAIGDFTKMIPRVTGNIFSLVMYFVAPISIFMLIWGGYYFITSAGDEERVKKGKSILINTGIAIIILLSALSFMTDLVKFQF